MDNGKIDQQLEMAMELPKEVLKADDNLEAGYIAQEDRWELIIKFSSDVEVIREIVMGLGAEFQPLSFGYGIIIIDESKINALSGYDEIEYIEKPRRLYFSVREGKAVSCINSLQVSRINGLFGNGVIVAIIDSGIDYKHRDFRNEDGTTRLISLWDQTIEGNPPEGFIMGTEYSREQINRALEAYDRGENTNIIPSIDISGHGTHVAGIACGNGVESNGRYAGVAPMSEILVVKIGDSIGESFPRTTRVMEALEYVMNIAIQEMKPLAINMSFGNNYGDHSGRNILEQYLNQVAGVWKTSICVGVGNEGEERKHVGGTVKSNESTIVELYVGINQGYVSMQIWKDYVDDIDLVINSPNGDSILINKNIRQTASYLTGRTIIYVYYGEPNPNNIFQEINIILYPKSDEIDVGIWKIELIPINIVSGRFDIWLGYKATYENLIGFVTPSAYKTLTIPSTAYRAISVGAYNGYTDSYATFSGRGTEDVSVLLKPDIVAPGVNITAPNINGGYVSRTGTSMATPFVTGSAALMLEWGIVNRNDIYLYGEKLKAYLIKGARQLDEYKVYPNPQVGWGALCLDKSIPKY